MPSVSRATVTVITLFRSAASRFSFTPLMMSSGLLLSAVTAMLSTSSVASAAAEVWVSTGGTPPLRPLRSTVKALAVPASAPLTTRR